MLCASQTVGKLLCVFSAAPLPPCPPALPCLQRIFARALFSLSCSTPSTFIAVAPPLCAFSMARRRASLCTPDCQSSLPAILAPSQPHSLLHAPLSQYHSFTPSSQPICVTVTVTSRQSKANKNAVPAGWFEGKEMQSSVFSQRNKWEQASPAPHAMACTIKERAGCCGEAGCGGALGGKRAPVKNRSPLQEE